MFSVRVGERTHFTLRSSQIFTPFPGRAERYKRPFFPSTTKLWNDIDWEIRESDSIGSLKRELANHYNVVKYFLPFDHVLDRCSSVIHSGLRLDACGLIIIFLRSLLSLHPFVAVVSIMTITHFFLQCPNYAVLRPDLLTAAARIAFDQWFKYSDQQKVEIFLLALLTCQIKKTLEFPLMSSTL